MAPSDERANDLRRVYWVGPVTVTAAVAAVWLVQIAAAAVENSLERVLRTSPLPAIFTAVLVTAGVIVFAIVASEPSHPLRIYRRIAFAALILSRLPDVAIGLGWVYLRPNWSLAIAYIVMHVAAWAVTVTMLTRLAARPPGRTIHERTDTPVPIPVSRPIGKARSGELPG